MSNAIYWFTNDLRLDDNLALKNAIKEEVSIDFIYCLDPQLLRANRLTCKGLGKYRYRFLMESLIELDEQLKKYGQHLRVYYQRPLAVIEHLYLTQDVRRIYHSVHAGTDENGILKSLLNRFNDLEFHCAHTYTLFEPDNLPFIIDDLPPTFTAFRQSIENAAIPIMLPQSIPKVWPSSVSPPSHWLKNLPLVNSGSDPFYNGGPISGLKHVKNYFNYAFAQSYKQTRNTLDDWNESTKFSAWLSQGCISARQVFSELKKHETLFGANDSTYWILFELYWREYFQWYAHKFKNKLFAFSGISGNKPMKSFYAERFQRWKNGNTPYPIVNACMKQLNATGYMSNRGRQLAASCLIHEFQLDWRYGAAYFEQQLIDYDVASNWGNWQYLAGVGADPRGGRQFNLAKQTKTYDPEGKFIHSWNGYSNNENIDSTDAADWPISPHS